MVARPGVDSADAESMGVQKPAPCCSPGHLYSPASLVNQGSPSAPLHRGTRDCWPRLRCCSFCLHLHAWSPGPRAGRTSMSVEGRTEMQSPLPQLMRSESDLHFHRIPDDSFARGSLKRSQWVTISLLPPSLGCVITDNHLCMLSNPLRQCSRNRI